MSLDGSMDEGGSSSSKALDFLFIIGSLPTGPACYIYSVMYDATPSVMAGALVLCYVVAAPIMYLTTISILSADSSHGSSAGDDLRAEIPSPPPWGTCALQM